MGFGGFMWVNLSEYPFMEYLNRAMQYWLVNSTLYDYYINRVGMLWVETLPSISLLYPYSPYEYVNETITGFPSQGHDYWASYWLIGWPAALLCLHPVNQSVPEPWWYYYSAYSMDQVPEQWVTSNDPYLTAVTTTTPITTSHDDKHDHRCGDLSDDVNYNGDLNKHQRFSPQRCTST
ncbi:hypothetical protein [Acidilobus sp.]|uniref:hypothetical protein n=1 Tax=Acidilobus sp. TaxID=1872109 RepID=UPI003D0663D8